MTLALEGRRVAVTGGTGFLGRHACAELQRRGAEVAALGRGDYDLTRRERVAALYREVRPSLVVHLAAACGGIGANVANPARFLHDNAVMGLHLLEEGRLAHLDRFVLVSTTCAYPADGALPLREESFWDGPPVPATGPYGMAKRLLHEACRAYREQHGLECAVVVPANLYGPGDHFEEDRSHVVAALVRRYVEAAEAGGERVVNWGSGRPTREFLHVRDAARGIAMAAEGPDDPHPVNLGTGIETPVADLARRIARAAGFRGATEWDAERPEGTSRRVLDVRRAERLLGFRAEVGLDEGLTETVEWYRARRARDDQARP